MVMYILVENGSYILGENNYLFAYILPYKSFVKLYFCLQICQIVVRIYKILSSFSIKMSKKSTCPISIALSQRFTKYILFDFCFGYCV